ncbi:uncharacterized protein LOC124485741 [Hypomesus transpacificus]|uniref:uncharacterized protein LOC124485741 n=1 Tax=Hypomesus transpacificus TaxID=137520 RepID=UPI001F077658|nr:uncharacterized protein LOC124485741 [Hypomesus transpacificus]
MENTITEYQEEMDRAKEENARLQRLLDLVFKPEIKLHRTDRFPCLKSAACDDDSSRHQELSQIIEVKVEQEEIWTTRDNIKTEPEAETSTASEPDLGHLIAATPEESFSDVEPDPVEQMDDVEPDPVEQMEKPKQRTMADFVKNMLYRGPQDDPPESLNSTVYKEFAKSLAPLVPSMDISCEIPLVDTAFGKVPVGSPLSYQMPLPNSSHTSPHPDMPPRPPLPLGDYRLQPTSCMFVFSEQELQYLKSIVTSWDMAHRIEKATRDKSVSIERDQLRRPRLTSHFWEICHIREQSKAEQLAERVWKGTPRTVKRVRGVESAAVWEYCRAINVNYSPCGFITHPDAPWLGCSPYGLSFDPTENPAFGLLEIIFPKTRSYVSCPFLSVRGGALQLKQNHSYFWQLQAQLLLTGLQWCDFVVFAEDDVWIQRIFRDDEVVNIIRKKTEHFFLYFYMPKCLYLNTI